MTALVTRDMRVLDVERARDILAACRNLDDAKEIRDQARAVERYLRDKSAATDARNYAFEIALRAERRMGELIAATKLNAGAASQRGHEDGPRLADLGVSKNESARAQKLAALPETEFDGRIRNAVEKEKLTVSGVLAVTSATDHDGDSWMTPPEYIEKARRVLGQIDLDPASNDAAQMIVKATSYFTVEDDGLEQLWHGRVWLNPPYSFPLVEKFTDKLRAEKLARRVSAAIVLVNAQTDAAWFQSLVNVWPTCFTAGRISFLLAGGGRVQGNSKGQAFFFLGCDPELVAREFRDVGAIVKRF